MANKTDLVGRRFGRLTVIAYHHSDKHWKTHWLCKCDCGNTKIVGRDELIKGDTKSCGCWQKELTSKKNTIDITGQKFGKLTVIERAYSGKNRQVYWRCKCDCGNEAIISGVQLRSGRTRSCGCICKTIKGLSRTRLYKLWLGMKARCYKPKTHQYKNYGGRGIQVCEEWKHSFMNFYDDMHESYEEACAKYGEMNTSIDRINVDVDYCKENCRWSDRITQANNTTKNVLICYQNRFYTEAIFCRKFGVRRHLVNKCIRNGKPIESVFEKQQPRIVYEGKPYTICGFGRFLGVSRYYVTWRLKKGMTPEEIAEEATGWPMDN